MAQAESRGTAPMGRFRHFWHSQLRDAQGALARLLDAPVATILTAAVIGITLMLPAALHLGIKNVRSLSYRWEESLQASLFLRDSVSEQQGRTLAQNLGQRAGVRDATYLSREQALDEFRTLSGFGDAINLLDSNPLPAVIVVTPQTGQTREQAELLLKALAALPEVEVAKLDQRWLERLYAILEIVRRGVFVFSVLLGFAVVVVIGNTIRLDIEARREEIVVLKLLGASDGFVRRPFLYAGLWYGVFGSFVALLLLMAGIAVLDAPIARLARLYEAEFALEGPSGPAVLTVIGTGLALGWLGAWWTVRRHLNSILPS